MHLRLNQIAHTPLLVPRRRRPKPPERRDSLHRLEKLIVILVVAVTTWFCANQVWAMLTSQSADASAHQPILSTDH